MDYKTEAQPKATAGGVPVFCAHDAIVAIEKLIPNPKNPNTHPDAQIQALGRIIRQTGWRAPITVSKRSGFIVKGHGRLAAAKLEGLTEVPVDYQNYTNEAEEYADLVADNRIAELAEIDNKLLADIFADIDTGEIPMELTGYTDKEVESLVTGLAEALHNDLTEPDEIPEAPEGDGMITQKGDLWILGRHRVVCGNSGRGRHAPAAGRKAPGDPSHRSTVLLRRFSGVREVRRKYWNKTVRRQRRAENADDQLGQPQHQRLPNADEGRPLRYRHKGGLHLHRLENVALFVGSGGGFGPCDPEYDRLE